MRIKRVAVWAIPALLVGGAAYLFGYSDLIQVKTISISPLADNKEINSVIDRPIFNLKVGENLARVNVRGAEQALNGISWVEKASISRNWISGKVSISISGRKAIAKVLIPGQEGSTYIDLKGVIYKDPSVIVELPVITIADPKLALNAANFITKIPPDLLTEMKSLDLSQTGTFDMALSRAGIPLGKGGKVLIHWGSDEDLASKIKVYQKLILLPENNGISEIDLSEPKFPIVKK